MSDILASMATYLLTSSELTDLIGTRLRPMRLPAGSTSNPTVMPYVTYQLVDEPVHSTHDKKTTFKARVQVDVDPAGRIHIQPDRHALCDVSVGG